VGNLIFRKQNLKGWKRPQADVWPILGNRAGPAIINESFLTAEV